MDLFTNVPHLTFSLSSTVHREDRSSCFSTKELPELSAPPYHEESVTKGSGQLVAERLNPSTKNISIFKRLIIPLVRCDQDISLQNDGTPLKMLKLEPHLGYTKPMNIKKKTFGKCKKTEKAFLHDKGRQKQVQDSKVLEGEATTQEMCSETCYGDGSRISNKQVPPRKRICEERQAVSSPLEYKATLVNFHQPSPTRKNLPTSRISYHRQAFSSPLKVHSHIQPEINPASYIKLSEHCIHSANIIGHDPKNIVKIFHRTVKRKTEFDMHIEESNNLAFLNQVMNFERNTIFGRCWHVYVPNCHFERSKKEFTEYHEAFIEAALEDEENPVGEALSLLKDFQSKRCPTLQSISKIITAWKKNTPRSIELDTYFVCMMVQILENYPEVAKSYIDESLLSHISKNNSDQSECNLIMAAIELDFFTRTLCDTFSFRRSIVYSSLSLSKNRKQIEGIVELLKVNIKTSTEASNDNDKLENVPSFNERKILATGLQSKSHSSCSSLLEKKAKDALSVYPAPVIPEWKKAVRMKVESKDIDKALRGLKKISKTMIRENLAACSEASQATQELLSLATAKDESIVGENFLASDDLLSAEKKAKPLETGGVATVDVKTAVAQINVRDDASDTKEDRYSRGRTNPIELSSNNPTTDSISILDKIALDFPQLHSDAVPPDCITGCKNMDAINKKNVDVDKAFRQLNQISNNMDGEDVCVYKSTYSPKEDIENAHAEDTEIGMQQHHHKPSFDLSTVICRARDKPEDCKQPERMLDEGDQAPSLSSVVTNVFFHQRLLALALESNISEEVTGILPMHWSFL